MTRTPRVLFLTGRLPSPPRDGGELRLESLVRAAAELGPTAVFGLAPGGPPPHAGVDRWHAATDAAAVRAVAGRDAVDFLVTGASPYAAYYSATIGAEIEAMVRDFAADVVVIEGVELSAYVPHVRSTTARVVYDADEVETNKHRGIASTDRHRGRAMLRRHLAQRVESLEAEAIGSADQVWYCSDHELAAAHARFPNVSVPQRVLSNAVEVESYSQSDRHDPFALVYVATYDYPPNDVAARFLVDEVIARLPKASLALVGSKPRDWMLALDDPRIAVTGRVPDVRPYLAAAGAMPIALWTGAGTRLKALEAFASGVPVVSTAKGIEGLPVVDGEHVLLADDGDSFARQLERLAEDAALAERIIDAARSFVRRRYSIDALREELRAAFAALTTDGVSA